MERNNTPRCLSSLVPYGGPPAAVGIALPKSREARWFSSASDAALSVFNKQPIEFVGQESLICFSLEWYVQPERRLSKFEIDSWVVAALFLPLALDETLIDSSSRKNVPRDDNPMG